MSLKNNLIYILIIALLIAILYATCTRKAVNSVITKSDTITKINYVYYKDSIKVKPIFVKGQRDTVLESSIQYIPSEDYQILLDQFQALKEDLLSRNIYKDSIQLDSLGWVKITDTLQKNSIIGRELITNIKIPEKMKIVQAPPVRQLYIGGSVHANSTIRYSGPFSALGVGLLYKDKKDRMFGANVQWNGVTTTFGMSYYTKISLKPNK